MSKHQAILSAAETVAYIYGDTETALRLGQLATEVEDAEEEGDSGSPLPICSVCGGSVAITPRVECQECGFVFSP